MKSKLVMTVLILSVAVMCASFSSAMAATYYVPLNVSNQDVVWQVDTMKLFSGKDVYVNTIVVHYWITGSEETPFTLYPYKITQGDGQVKLWFNSVDMPVSAAKNTVEGSLSTGETFLATGPGWVMGTR